MPPQINEETVLWIEGIDVWDITRTDEKILVVQRLWLEAPILLEAVRPGALFATPKVKHPKAFRTGVAHQLPIHEVVRL